jgi:hypothetical protein
MQLNEIKGKILLAKKMHLKDHSFLLKIDRTDEKFTGQKFDGKTHAHKM